MRHRAEEWEVNELREKRKKHEDEMRKNNAILQANEIEKEIIELNINLINAISYYETLINLTSNKKIDNEIQDITKFELKTVKRKICMIKEKREKLEIELYEINKKYNFE